MDVQRCKYLSFVRALPGLLLEWIKLEVTIDFRASVIDSSGKRYVTPYECEVRGLTYAFTVIANCRVPYVVMQVPLMLDDGTFLVKGKRRVLMLMRKRASVPVLLGQGQLAVGGGQLDGAKRIFTPSYGVQSVPVPKASKVGVCLLHTPDADAEA